MEPEVRERFERIEALLHAMVERGNQMEIRFNRRAEQAEQRMDRAEQRMLKFDLRLEATRKLVQAGVKLVIQIGERQKETDVKLKELTDSVRELSKTQKAFLESLRKGRNGSRHAA